MRLARLAVSRPIAILIFVGAMVALGFQGYRLLKVDRFPAINVPLVGVHVSWPGATAEGIEELVVKVLEDAVAGGNKPDPLVIRSIPIATVNGLLVRVGDVATVFEDQAPLSISRADRQRQLSVAASVQGWPLGDVSNEMRQAVTAGVVLPDGYRVAFLGQVAQLDAALLALGQVLIPSIFVIDTLLAALALTGNTLNIFSVLGIILLLGLVAKKGILPVDYANTLRERGLALREAVLDSARTRLRPILMTTTIICAITPLALKLEEGAESRAPLAVGEHGDD